MLQATKRKVRREASKEGGKERGKEEAMDLTLVQSFPLGLLELCGPGDAGAVGNGPAPCG